MRAMPLDFAFARICGPKPPFSHALTFAIMNAPIIRGFIRKQFASRFHSRIL
jgi:hypothetical protein